MIMGENRWRKLFKSRWRRIYDRVHHYGLYTILHMCGDTSEVVPDLIEVGLDCMESCQPECMDIYRLKRLYGKDIRFWGGLGAQHVLPFGTAGEVRREIADILEAVRREWPDFRYEMRDLWSVDPVMTDAGSPLVRALDAGIETVLGKPSSHVASPGTYDQKHVQRIGHLRDCVAYGPGILDLAHQPDEYVGIDDMVQSAQVMAAATVDLLTGTGGSA